MDLKKTAGIFLHMVSRGESDEAFERYASADFRHHNPYYPGDAASLSAGMKDVAREFPAIQLSIQRSLQDGDLVAVHSFIKVADNHIGSSVVHIFRFENGKIAEMWDIGQDVPGEIVNQYGMF
jgi:predicted SnoaL-like aldol condensation-catalyzing enzyme